MRALPIDPLLPELTQTLSTERRLVLQAPPGAGKTTRVPAALLDAGFAADGEILVAEPRRLAARLAARFVASERGERIGKSIGYSVRFDDVSSRATRVRYVTEGVLVRRFLDDPLLRGVSVVVLDEFHERHLATDIVLSLVRRLQASRRPDLGLVVMSATIQADAVARSLDDCAHLQSSGREFPVEIEHLARPDDRPLTAQATSAVKRLLRESDSGGVLVFLPGAGEIRRLREALLSIAELRGAEVLALHGDLPLDEQARAVGPSSRRKVVLSTNVAESSVTVDGITAVVDTGLARVLSYPRFSGIPRLVTGKISRASAQQRSGRAGRTAPGRALRLYTRGDHDLRPEQDAPEILRQDLCEALLFLHGLKIPDPERLPWLTPPPAASREAAEALLALLGALEAGAGLTEIGRRMLAFPSHPRLARLVVEGERLGVASEACLAAALLGERDIRRTARLSMGGHARTLPQGYSGPSDVLELMDRFREAEDLDFDPARLRAAGLDPRAVRAVRNAHRRLQRLVHDAVECPEGADAVDRAVCRCVLAGFADRVARRRDGAPEELILSNGMTARLVNSCVQPSMGLMVAVDVEQSATGRRATTLVRLASGIEAEWLLDDHPTLLASDEQLEWNPRAERVEVVQHIACGSVVLEESRARAPASETASRLLAHAALTAKASDWMSAPELVHLRRRIGLARRHRPDLGWPSLEPEQLEATLHAACAGKTSFSELSGTSLAEEMRRQLGGAQRAALDQLAPEHVRLPGGRNLPIHYEDDQPPWVASRLQDFFGMQQGPAVAGSQVALTLHLLAPNQRAVQVTQDLAGFWERHYPGVRKELMRRYPKHDWPEDGAHATPPPAGRSRGTRRRR